MPSPYYSTDDPIAAIASAPGGAPRALVRVSGWEAPAIVARVGDAESATRLATLRTAVFFSGQAILDDHGRLLPVDFHCWPGPRSFTGEPVVELHTFGSTPLLEWLLERLFQVGARQAEPGEFTLRAFLSGRLDLTQAEAVLGTIEAVGPHGLQAALIQLAGGLAGPLEELRARLVDLSASLEAGLDFADEPIEFVSREDLIGQLDAAAERTVAILRQVAGRAVGDEAIPHVVLTGRANAGKSSLFNSLVGREAALVSNRPGTTRDYVEQRVEWEGTTLKLIDTAGRETLDRDPITTAGRRMTQRRGEEAELRVHCIDATAPLDSEDAARLETPIAPGRLTVWTKCDTNQPPETAEPVPATSSRTGRGLENLKREICRRLLDDRPVDVVPATARRCEEGLHRAAEALLRARGLAENGTGEELVASELRVALDELGRIVGTVYTEDILDRIFSRFCIGK